MGVSVLVACVSDSVGVGGEVSVLVACVSVGVGVGGGVSVSIGVGGMCQYRCQCWNWWHVSVSVSEVMSVLDLWGYQYGGISVGGMCQCQCWSWWISSVMS